VLAYAVAFMQAGAPRAHLIEAALGFRLRGPMFCELLARGRKPPDALPVVADCALQGKWRDSDEHCVSRPSRLDAAARRVVFAQRTSSRTTASLLSFVVHSNRNWSASDFFKWMTTMVEHQKDGQSHAQTKKCDDGDHHSLARLVSGQRSRVQNESIRPIYLPAPNAHG